MNKATCALALVTNEQWLSPYSSPCFGAKTVYNYGFSIASIFVVFTERLFYELKLMKIHAIENLTLAHTKKNTGTQKL